MITRACKATSTSVGQRRPIRYMLPMLALLHRRQHERDRHHGKQPAQKSFGAQIPH